MEIKFDESRGAPVRHSVMVGWRQSFVQSALRRMTGLPPTATILSVHVDEDGIRVLAEEREPDIHPLPGALEECAEEFSNFDSGPRAGHPRGFIDATGREERIKPVVVPIMEPRTITTAPVQHDVPIQLFEGGSALLTSRGLLLSLPGHVPVRCRCTEKRPSEMLACASDWAEHGLPCPSYLRMLREQPFPFVPRD